MSYSQLLSSLGFEADPFAKTNADEEDRLERYFVPPPFFNAVYGDPLEPKSAIVFAPRGGGKTALKRKIEVASPKGNFLCITYNNFDVSGNRIEQIDSDFHLKKIVELLTVAVIGVAAIAPESNLEREEKHTLYIFAKAYLSDLKQSEIREDINSVKNFSDKAKDAWNKFTGPLGVVLNALLVRFGLGQTQLSKIEEQKSLLGPYKAQLETLSKLAYRLGYPSVYVLIDRVDETPLTTNSRDATAAFVLPLITDLHLLELPRFAFKFFLWDLLRQDYQKKGRADRVKAYSLEWEYQQLTAMLSERLKAYSRGKVESLQQISDVPFARSLDEVVAIFAQGSPRNMVRICKEILDQQSEINSQATKLSEQAVRSGFDKISENIALELFDEKVVQELQRCRRCDFTIRFISTEIFKFTSPAGTNKVENWKNAGAVIQLGTLIEKKGNRPSGLYGVTNFFLAKHIFGTLPIGEFIRTKIQTCPNCQKIVLRDWDLRTVNQCQYCQHEVTRSTATP